MPGRVRRDPSPAPAAGEDEPLHPTGRLGELLSEVSDLPPADQVGVFEQIHTALADRLNEQPE